MKKQHHGFTLIELLIVVAIIAILAAIAVPNFLEAQVRSKVSRVKADFRSIATGIETYAVDHNHYPPDHFDPQYRLADVKELTTPIAYLTTVDFVDPFIPNKNIPGNDLKGFQYFNFYSGWGAIIWPSYVDSSANHGPKGACLKSWGPNAGKGGASEFYGDDGGEWIILGADTPETFPEFDYQIDRIYDATNGTVSNGDIIRLVGDSRGLEQQI